MPTKIILSSCALILALTGIGLTFMPQEAALYNGLVSLKFHSHTNYWCALF